MRSNDRRPTRPTGTIFLAIPAAAGGPAAGRVTAGNAAVVVRVARRVDVVRREVSAGATRTGSEC